MRTVTEDEVVARLESLPGPEPRVVVGGNFATPTVLLRDLDAALESVRTFSLNAQTDWPRRAGLVTETPFVGPGVRHDPSLEYLPMRLSLVPPPLRHPPAGRRGPGPHLDAPAAARCRSGSRSTSCRAAIERVAAPGRPGGGPGQPNMPYTFGDGEIAVDQIDLALEVDAPLPTRIPRPADRGGAGDRRAGGRRSPTTARPCSSASARSPTSRPQRSSAGTSSASGRR